MAQSISQVDVVASEFFETTIQSTNFRLPYFSNKNIAVTNGAVTKIIIVVHGTNRNADDYFETMEDALFQRADLIDQTIIIAPQFLTEEDVEAFNLDRDYPYWSSDGWKVGANSKNSESNPRDARIPSYELLDSLILSLSRTFTSVDELVFTGHSAGGQLTNRYTASTPLISTLCADYGINTKSIIANPGSYVYMSPMRREGESSEFTVPTNCSEYNEYSYGLEDLYTYHRRVGSDNMKIMYAQREVIYLFGSLDNDPDASTLPRSCRAMLQGAHRLERGLNYYDHIIDTYGKEIKSRHRMEIIDRVGHNNYNMYNHPTGLKHLFDEAPISSCDQTTSILEISSNLIRVYPNPTRGIIQVEEGTSVKSLTLYDLNGSIIGSTDKREMHVGELAAGLYVLSIESNGQQHSHRIVISR